MSAREFYVFWELADRVGIDSFVVRRCLARLKADEITLREATEFVRWYEILATGRIGVLDDRSRNTTVGVHHECDLGPSRQRDMTRGPRVASASKPKMHETTDPANIVAEIVTPTYVGPDRRRRPWRISSNLQLDTDRRSAQSWSSSFSFVAARDI